MEMITNHSAGADPATAVAGGRSPNQPQLSNHRFEVALFGDWHAYANLFPMLDASAQDALRTDIQLHGIRQPVIFFAGRIFDGRNRYVAARDLNLKFPAADFVGTDAEARDYVLPTNLHRRHLTESQRAVVAAKLANMKQGERTDLPPSANLPKVSQSEAAVMLNVSKRSVTTANKVNEQGTPELIASVEQGAVSISAAAIVSDLPKDEQAAILAAGPQAIKAKAKTIREKTSETNGAEVAERDADPESDPVIRELAKLTPLGVAMAVMELRNALADAKANTSGRVMIHEDRQGGVAWNWATGQSQIFSVRGHGEVAVSRPRDIAKERQQEAERQEVAAICDAIVKGCHAAKHQYLARKGFPDQFGLVCDDPRGILPNTRLGEALSCALPDDKGPFLIVPGRIGGKITTVQFISPDGVKKNILRGQMGGASHRISTGRETWVCEGIATALSVKAALQFLGRSVTVLCAFSASNVANVASGVPGAIIAADHDKPVETFGGLGTGEYYARRSGLKWAMPPHLGDWNDYHHLEGLRAVAVKLGEMSRGA